MASTAVGLGFRETMEGPFALDQSDPDAGAAAGKKAGTRLALHGQIAIDDLDRFIADPDHKGVLSGSIEFAPLGGAMAFSNGVFNLFSPAAERNTKYMIYEGGFVANAVEYYFAGRKIVRDDRGFDLWKDTTTLFSRLHRGRDATGPVVGAGIIGIDFVALAKMLSTVTALNAPNPAEAAKAVARFGQFFAAEIYDTYARLSGAQPR